MFWHCALASPEASDLQQSGFNRASARPSKCNENFLRMKRVLLIGLALRGHQEMPPEWEVLFQLRNFLA